MAFLIPLNEREGGFFVRPSRPVSFRGAMGQRRMTLSLPVGPLACEQPTPTGRKGPDDRYRAIHAQATRPGHGITRQGEDFNCCSAGSAIPRPRRGRPASPSARCRPADGAHGKLSRPRNTQCGDSGIRPCAATTARSRATGDWRAPYGGSTGRPRKAIAGREGPGTQPRIRPWYAAAA